MKTVQRIIYIPCQIITHIYKLWLAHGIDQRFLNFLTDGALLLDKI